METYEYITALERALHKIASKVDVVIDDPHSQFSSDELTDIADAVEALQDYSTRTSIKLLEQSVATLSEKIGTMTIGSKESMTAQKAIEQGQKQAAELAKLKAEKLNLENTHVQFLQDLQQLLNLEDPPEFTDDKDALRDAIFEALENTSLKAKRDLEKRLSLVDGECSVLYRFLHLLEEAFKGEYDLMLSDGREAFINRIKAIRIDAESVEPMSENIEELYEKLRDAEERYGRLDAMLEQAEGDIDKIATSLGLTHENQDRELLISKIRDKIEQIKEERDKLNQMHDDEARIMRQAEGELSKIATALGVSNENGSDVRLDFMLRKACGLRNLQPKLKEREAALSGLLARIHRDGGHATERLGIDAATEAAHGIVAELLVAKDEADNYKRNFEAELEGNKKIRKILGARDDETMFELAQRMMQRGAVYQVDMTYLRERLIDLANRCGDRNGQLEAGEM